MSTPKVASDLGGRKVGQWRGVWGGVIKRVIDKQQVLCCTLPAKTCKMFRLQGFRDGGGAGGGVGCSQQKERRNKKLNSQIEQHALFREHKCFSLASTRATLSII